MEKEQTKQFNEFERRFKIPLTLENFKLISKRNYDNGHFKKLGHARESFAKELGFNCYRAYTKEFNKYWNILFNNISRIIKHHKDLMSPIPLIIVVDTDIDYIDMIKNSYSEDFNYFSNFTKEDLFINGRAFSQINVYDVCTKLEFENDISNLYKYNSKQVHLNKYGNELDEWKDKFNDYRNSKIDKLITDFQDSMKEINPDVAFFTIQAFSVIASLLFTLNDKDTEDAFIELLTDENNGLPSKDEIKTLTDNELLARTSKISESLIRIARSKGKIAQINDSDNLMTKNTPNPNLDFVSKNDYAFYFDDFTINKTRDLIDRDSSSLKINNDKRIFDALSNIIKKQGTEKSVKVGMSNLFPKKRISEDEIFKNLNELKEKGLIDSFKCTENSITTRINSKFKDLIIKE